MPPRAESRFLDRVLSVLAISKHSKGKAVRRLHQRAQELIQFSCLAGLSGLIRGARDGGGHFLESYTRWATESRQPVSVRTCRKLAARSVVNIKCFGVESDSCRSPRSCAQQRLGARVGVAARQRVLFRRQLPTVPHGISH